MKYFQVEYQRDLDTKFWTATVPDLPAVVAQGKTLEETFKRVREAIQLVLEDEDPFILMGGTATWVGYKHFAEPELEVLKEGADLRICLLETRYMLDRVNQRAVRLFNVESDFSYGEVGQFIGVTRQRVEQIAKKIKSGADDDYEQGIAEI